MSACKIAGEILGKVFTKGVYTTYGCYHYETGKYSKNIYFGTNGTLDQNKDTPTKSGQIRPVGIDCKTGIQNRYEILDSALKFFSFASAYAFWNLMNSCYWF